MARKHEKLEENLPISSLTPDPRNARVHSKDDLEALQVSIQRNGFRGCIIVQELDDGTRVVRAGNGRVAALKALGYAKVPRAEVLYGWSDAEAMEYALADNRTAQLSDWDWEELSTQLAELGDAGALTGFSTDEIDLLTTIEFTPAAVQDEAPYQAPQEPEEPGETPVPQEPEKPGTRTVTLHLDACDRLCALTGKDDPVIAIMALLQAAEDGQ